MLIVQQKFSFLVNLVKVHPVEELVNKLRRGKVITREQVIKESMCNSLDATVDPERVKSLSLHGCLQWSAKLKMPIWSLHPPLCL
jgi:hypothetical protein